MRVLAVFFLSCFCLPVLAELSSDILSKAEAGDVEAQFAVGMYYYNEGKDDSHRQLALSWFEKSARQKHVPSLYEYGYLTMLSHKDNESFMRGVAFMNLAADMGYAQAQYQIGLIHGLRGEFAEAIPLFEKAAAQEHTGSMVVMADYYEDGFNVPKDPKKAFELINRAIELGSSSAKNWLGKRYVEGRGVKKDPKKAFEIYLSTAALGDAEGQTLVASCYRLGTGTKINYAESVKFARLSLAQNRSDAAGSLAMNYIFGYGVKKNPALGYALLRYCGNGCNAEMRIKLLLMSNDVSEPEKIVGEELGEKMRNSTNVLAIVDDYENQTNK